MSTKFIVECPDCKVRFFVTEELLATAYGVLRCGFCSHVFNGKEHVVYQTLNTQPKKMQSTESESKQSAISESRKNTSDDSPAYWSEVVDTLSSFSINFKSINDNNTVSSTASLGGSTKNQQWLIGEPSSNVSGDVDIEHVDADIVERIEHIDFDQLLTLDEQALLKQETATINQSRELVDVLLEENKQASPFLQVESTNNSIENQEPKDIYGNALKKVSYNDFVSDIPTPKKSKSTFIWAILSVLGLLCLAGQYIRFIAPEMALKEDTRALAEKACDFLWCDIPPLIDLTKIKTNQLVVSESQQFENVLQVDAIIENKLTIAQPYPTVELRFTDLNGQPVASRRFLPGEYLSEEAVRNTPMQPNTPTYISFEVIDPGETAVGYTLYYYSAN